jgi:hypothetical protein
MLERLSGDVFPCYSRLAKQGYDFDRILSSPNVSPWDALPEDSELKPVLSKWAAACNADVEWIKSLALRILRDWYAVPAWRESLQCNPVQARLITTAGEDFEFRYPYWELEWQWWSTYRKLVRAEFERSLSDYEKRTRKLAESRGLVRTQRTYSRNNFEWFALYQFAGLPLVAVAKWWKDHHKGQIDGSTVFKGIKTAAKLAGWQRLRTPQRNRNRKIR